MNQKCVPIWMQNGKKEHPEKGFHVEDWRVQSLLSFVCSCKQVRCDERSRSLTKKVSTREMKCASLSYSKAWTILIHAVRAQPLDRQAEVDQRAGSSVDLFHQQIESIVDFDPVRLALCLLQILFPEQKKSSH